MSNQATKLLRSPSYPSMSLANAVDAIAKIEKVYRQSAIDRKEAARLLGYRSLSGPAGKALADLAAYGLLQRAGKGETRVTERAQAILHPNSDSERLDALKAAAFAPPLFCDLRERFEGVDMPPPIEGVINQLNRKNFNPSAVRPATRAFLGTVDYLETQGVNDSHGMESSDDEISPSTDSKEGSATYGGARIGDHIQWESQGAYQFKEHRRVRAVEVHDGQEWVFVDGETTGIPMNHVIVRDRAEVSGVPTPPTLPLGVDSPAGDVSPGESERLEYKLSDTTRVRLLVSGELGVRELGRLIRLLNTQRAILEDEKGDGDNDDNGA